MVGSGFGLCTLHWLHVLSVVIFLLGFFPPKISVPGTAQKEDILAGAQDQNVRYGIIKWFPNLAKV